MRRASRSSGANARLSRMALVARVITSPPTTIKACVVLIGESPAPPSHRQLLINLANRLPDDFGNFERIAEIVDVDPENKRLSRERYKAYRERGCELDTHNL